MKEGKPFFFRIDLIALMEIAAEPETHNMTVRDLAKELKKGQSDFPAIQRILDDTQEYMDMAIARGKAGAAAKAERALLKQTQVDLSIVKRS
jgi:hypothetical protein